jgi:hypothetical protein
MKATYGIRFCLLYIMGGGLFGTPLALNPKCLVFSGLLIAIYWMPPYRNLSRPADLAFFRIVTILLAFTGYILLAWYDVLYDANDRLHPTFLGWLSLPFKPAYYTKEFNDLPLKWQKTVRTVDVLALIAAILFVVAPFFV